MNTVVIYDGLQRRSEKKIGIFPFKKYVFEAEQWVALCIHRQQILLLEWYSAANEISTHEPNKVEDLFDCAYVKISAKDARCFEIGFIDEKRPVIIFAARHDVAALEWVENIKKHLRELKCLKEVVEEYEATPASSAQLLPQQKNQQQPQPQQQQQHQQNPATPTSSRKSCLNEDASSSDSTSPSNADDFPPPLPPRQKTMHF